MYSKFQLNLNDTDLLNIYYNYNNNQKNNNQFLKDIKQYINNVKEIDVEKIINMAFPNVTSQIFLSYSHNNNKYAISLVQYFKKVFDLDVFVDCLFWESCDTILKEIDNKYCLFSDKKTYDYNKRNLSTAHMHMILYSAINKIIDSTECFMLLKTDQSIDFNIQNNIEKEKTNSPWIYSEIITANSIRVKEPDRGLKKIQVDASATTEARNFHADSLQEIFSYKIDTSKFINLNMSDLKCWKNKINNYDFQLDTLYEMKGLLTKCKN